MTREELEVMSCLRMALFIGGSAGEVVRGIVNGGEEARVEGGGVG